MSEWRKYNTPFTCGHVPGHVHACAWGVPARALLIMHQLAGRAVPPHARCACVRAPVCALWCSRADVSVNYNSAPPKLWKTDLEKKVVRIFHVYSLFPERMRAGEKKRRRDGWGAVITQRAACLHRHESRVCSKGEKIRGQYFLDMDVPQPHFKAEPPQRAVCLCLD